MSKILVTGASGSVGKKTLQHLLKRKPASQLVGLVRDPSKAEDLAALGIELRQGDYMDSASLTRAFKDIQKLLLISTHAFTDRNTAHANVIDAALQAGVEHLVFTPIIRKDNSGYVLQEVTKEDIFAEQKLLSSGLTYTLAQYPPFLDALPTYIGIHAHETGVRVPIGSGKTAAASRDDLAEANAAILTGNGHENKHYTLTGDPAVSFAGMAEILSEIYGKKVPYIPISDQEYIDLKIAEGLPDFVAEFFTGWLRGMNSGEWEQQTKDLETLIGHQPTSTEEYFRSKYLKEASQ